MAPIIFLDIDGVLKPAERAPFLPSCIAQLNRITDRTGAQIVLHTSRRYHTPLDGLRNLLQTIGVTGNIIDTTPMCPGRDSGGYVSQAVYAEWAGSTDAAERPTSIQKWLDAHKGKRFFVILDDNPKMQHLSGFHICTDPQQGLTPAQADQAIKLLKGVTW